MFGGGGRGGGNQTRDAVEPRSSVQRFHLERSRGAHDTTNITTKSLTSFPDAVNHRWRVSRSRGNRTVCRDGLMLDQRITVEGPEQRQVALNSVEATPEPGSQESKVLQQEVVRTHRMADLFGATTTVSTSFASCMWVTFRRIKRCSATIVVRSGVDVACSRSFHLARDPPAVHNHHAQQSNRGTFGKRRVHPEHRDTEQRLKRE